MLGARLPPTQAVPTWAVASRLHRLGQPSLVSHYGCRSGPSWHPARSQRDSLYQSTTPRGYSTVLNGNAAGFWERRHGPSPTGRGARDKASRSQQISLSASSARSVLLPERDDAAAAEPGEDGMDRPVQLMDLNYVKRNCPLPTSEAYPNGLPELFNPVKYSLAIHNECSRAGKSLRLEIVFGEKTGLSKEDLRQLGTLDPIKTCMVKVDIADVCHQSGTGEGRNRPSAKRAAWALIVSSMHTNGTLQRLIAPTARSTDGGMMELTDADDTESPIESREEEALASDEDLEPAIDALTPLDEEALASEKDTKIDIYNYAARYGLVPSFTAELVSGHKNQKEGGKESTTLFKVIIKIPEMKLQAMAIQRDLNTAETMAGVAFKRRAEKRHHEAATSTLIPRAWNSLSTDTALQFLRHYQHRVGDLDLEMQHETVEGAETVNVARLAVNGKFVGQKVTMRSKSKARQVAYLAAAVEIAKTDPLLLQDFAQSSEKIADGAPSPLHPINLEPGQHALQAMKDALVEARRSGLPDAKPDLRSDVSALGDGVPNTFRALSPARHKQVSAQLLSTQKRLAKDASGDTSRSARASLPMNVHRREVLEMIENNQYSIVIGRTGSGKTTQVPQILFESRIHNRVGSSCNIICTQPRRIAAMSVARRVAAERQEDLRQTVGYHVRLDAKMPRHSHGITYCTTGVLLQKLIHQRDAVLDSTSHIIIDEVHERELAVDFLLIALKRAIERRQASGLHVPKVVLMSATIDPEQFADYLGQIDDNGVRQPCPTLTIPGRTFRIRKKYLGSIMHEMLTTRTSELKALFDADPDTRNFLDSETKLSAVKAAASSGEQVPKDEGVIDWKRKPEFDSQIEDDAAVSQAALADTPLPLSLVAATVAHICSTSHDGSVLIFLSGLDEITAVERFLKEQNPFSIDFADDGKYKICKLHSAIPKEQQDEALQSCPPGCRKIILSTNIAETSVTVPDVKYVVDTGMMRESRFDQRRRITALQRVWASKSNLKQRAGRAGRVQDGEYYGLFSKERADSLRSVALPELLRTDLQGTCLAVRAHDFVDEDINTFLSEAIEPPSRRAVDAAVCELIAKGALAANQEMTALGRLLSKLPIHPALGKMVVLGMLFRCLDPMIILGAASDDRSLLTSPIGFRREAEAAHALYGEDGRSDHLATLRAFNDLRRIRDESGRDAATARARERYLDMHAFITIDQNARQIESILAELKLMPEGKAQSVYGSAELNQNSENNALVRALLLAGVFPNLAAKNRDTGRYYRTRAERAVVFHPASLNTEPRQSSTEKASPAGTLFAFSTLRQGSANVVLYMRDSTHVTPLMAALFGGELRMTDANRLEMDEWLPFLVRGEDRDVSTRVILEFRKALDRVLTGAFNSLSDSDQDGGPGLIDDPIRERFVGRVVQVLQNTSILDSATAWPSDAQSR